MNTNPRRMKFLAALATFAKAAGQVSQAWPDDMFAAALYPKGLPDFDTLAADLRRWLEAEARDAGLFVAGDRIIPAGWPYIHESVLVVNGYEGTDLLAGPEGGGFLRRFDEKAQAGFMFRLVTAADRETYQRAVFRLGDDLDLFGGWTNGASWNGWATPFLSRAEAERLAKFVSTWATLTFDAAGVLSVQMVGEDDDTIVTLTPARVDGVPSEGPVYAFGDLGWTWELFARAEAVALADADVSNVLAEYDRLMALPE